MAKENRIGDMTVIHERRAPPEITERMDKIPAGALLRVGRVMGEGMKYEHEPDGWAHWRTQPAEYHLNRALRHMALCQLGDITEDHAGHVAARILMWLELL